ncbi:SDR family NAD(P)-dependent oxidoreductase [Kordiimonas gwangyangensis]|uniref:SDR family NAD(P)-dependent oxidoreductase n=1 Tax=Kordiimonas gwangyangensis TaxID=288022 RepID=UPI00192E5181|nr:SDR family oxidoreductase [Kordiimonas gwangyangensis]
MSSLTMNLENQTILVTGASRGIGAATARALLMAGANVIGSYARAPGELDALASEYGAGRLLAVQSDLGEAGAADALWHQALAFKGDITGLVNNAGVMPDTPLDSADSKWAADWAHIMAVNVQAVADLCRRAILHFESRGGQGRIVTIASRAAFRGDGPDYMHYAASKGAVVSLMRSIARAYARQGIYAFLIAPGWVKTDMAAVAYEPGNEWMLDEIPTGEAAPPENIANMSAFLLSGLCDHSTGATFDINGASYVR